MRVCFATSSERLDSSQTSREHGSPCSVQYSQTYTSSIYSTNSTQYCIVGLFFQGKTHHHKPGAKTSSTVRYEQCKLQCENPTHFKYTWRYLSCVGPRSGSWWTSVLGSDFMVHSSVRQHFIHSHCSQQQPSLWPCYNHCTLTMYKT